MRSAVAAIAIASMSAFVPAPAAAACPGRPAGPATTIYLPNVTKTFGGPDGWHTPFIVQNTSRTSATSLEIDLFRFADAGAPSAGSGTDLLRRVEVCSLRPSTSFAYEPNADRDLPDDTQLSAVIRSYGADAVAVVNQHRGSGARAEAASYVGATRGSTSVSLPNITKRFFGFVTPFIIQNLGTMTTTATASFVSFDGTHTATLTRTISPGRSQFIDPNAEPALRDGTQYAVTVASPQPISVVVNTHNAASLFGNPIVYSTSGVAEGTSPLLGPYAVKNVPGVGTGISTIVVQNLGSAATAPTLGFQPLGGGPVALFTGPSIVPRASWAFDPRFVNGDSARGLCGSAASPGCLGDGEHSFVARADNDAIAAVVNVIGAGTAAGYSAVLNGATRVFLPNVTRRLGGTNGWTTVVAAQSNTATGATLSWYRFADAGAGVPRNASDLVTTQSLTLGPGASKLVDPRDVAALADDTRYSVVVEASGGTVGVIALQLSFQGGDGAMAYEGLLR